MLTPESRANIFRRRSTDRRWPFSGERSGHRRSRMESNSWRFVLGVALRVGVVSFLATELMHY